MTPQAASFSSESYTPDRLIAGSTLLHAKKVTIITGQNLVRGAVLGKITASSKYNLSLSGAADGSQVPDLVLADDCNAAAADKEAMAYETGDFAESALTIGAAHTVATIREGLRAKGIHLINIEGA